ncbi:hypothetical protein GCM10027452_45540 [Micromonospora halotolerans]
MVALRWVCTTERTSTPGVVRARASLIDSSSRGRSARLIGVANQSARSARPASVISYGRCPPSLSPGRLLERGAELVAVHLAALQQGEQAVADGHGVEYAYLVCGPQPQGSAG